MTRGYLTSWLAALSLGTLCALSPPAHSATVTGRTPGQFGVSTKGDAQYSIALATPPGTHGLAPSLVLDYSSADGNGWIGMGFTIPVFSAITRCPFTPAQDPGQNPQGPFSAADKFCLDGNRLRLTGGTPYGAANTTYQTEIESFRRITILGADSFGPTAFELRTPDGRTYEYGNTADSQIHLLAGGGGLSQVRLYWALNRIRDPDGNYIDFTYTQDATQGGYYPQEIRWTGNLNNGTAPAYKVTFTNESADRPDVILNQISYTGPASVNPQFNYSKRLSLIEVRYIPTNAIVRQYRLAYAPTPTGGHSLVQSVQECGLGGTDCFLPTQFTWLTPSGTLTVTSPGASVPAGVTPIVMDLNGDGIDDLVWSSSATSGSGTWLYMLGTASGFGSLQNTGIANNGFASARKLEWNGDNKADLLVQYSGANWSVLRSNGAGFNAPVDTGVPAQGIAAVTDVNGDGRDDLIYGSPTLRNVIALRLNTGSAFGPESSTVSFLWPVLRMYASSAKGRAASRRRQDFDGDGFEDLFVILDQITDGPTGAIHKDLGHIVFGAGTTLRDGTDQAIAGFSYIDSGDFNGDRRTDFAYFLSGAARTNLSPGSPGPAGSGLIVDWDGDGRDDLLTSSGGNFALARSNGLSFDPATSIGVTFNPAVVGDFNGDGLADLIVINGGALQLAARATATPWAMRETLQSASDGYGVSATFAYGLLSDPAVHTPTAGPGYPLSDVASPQGVVKTLTATDGTASGSTYTQTFTYQGAHEDLSGRGFLGFTQRTIQDSRTPTVRVEQTYRQDFPYIAATTGVTLKQNSSNATVSQQSLHWTTLSLASGLDARDFPYVDTQTNTQYELGGPKDGALITTTTTTRATPDTAGNFPSVTTTVTDNDSGSPYVGQAWSTTTALIVTPETTHWCLNLPSQVKVTKTAPGVSAITRTVNFDTPDYVHCRESGHVTEPGGPYAVTQALQFDAFGNVTTETVTGAGGMTPRATVTEWVSSGRFPQAITNAASERTTLDYDPVFGTLITVTDPNGLITRFEQDGFGRQTAEVRPDLTSIRWAYNDCASAGCVGIGNKMTVVERAVNTDGTTLTDLNIYLDRFDRTAITSGRLLTGAYDRTETQYDAMGRVARQAAPCAFANCALYWETFSYDALSRPTQTQRPISANNSTLQTTTIEYAGRTTTVTDPQLKHTTRITTVVGNVGRSQDHDGYYQSFSYDAFGSLTGVTDSLGNSLMSATYDYGEQAFQRSLNDTDLGPRSFTYNALGEMTSWSDAKGQSFSATYDALSRPLTRSEPKTFTQWTWGASAAAHNVGRLQGVCMGEGITNPTDCTTSPGYAESAAYDGLGRLSQRTVTLPSEGTHAYGFVYHANTGLLDTLTYPQSAGGYALQLRYGYSHGYLQSIANISDSPNVTLWTANDSNAAGQITQETLGNGVVTQRAYDAVTRELATVQSGVGGGAALQNESYLYDLVGNVIQRQNNNQGLTESFCYDNLYRLDHSTLSGVCSGTPNLQMHYDALGNITSRSDVANGTTWTYDSVKKHAVTQAGTGGPSYGYDANGNANLRNGFAIAWTSYNKPSSITSADESVQFSYDHTYEHWRATYTQGGVTETTYFIGGLMEKVVGVGGAVDYRHFVYAGDEKVAIYSRTQAGVNTLRYVREDHQGSVAAILNASGQCEVKESFTAFGARRSSCTWSGAPTNGALSLINAVTRHGYTWQTALGAMGLNDMHGRVQDAVTGRFLSADPYVPEPMFTQGFNRYSYVNNNPLSYTDPSGFAGFPGCDDDCGFREPCDFGLCSVDPGFLDLFGEGWGFTEFPGVAHEQYLHVYIVQSDFRAAWGTVDHSVHCGQSCMKAQTKVEKPQRVYSRWEEFQSLLTTGTTMEKQMQMTPEEWGEAVNQQNLNFALSGEGGADSSAILGAVALGKGISRVLAKWAARVNLSQARAVRDALVRGLAPLGRRAPATVIGGYNTRTGQVTARACGGGKCAEDHVAEALGGNKDEIRFTEAVRPRTGREVAVCTRCEASYGREPFPAGTLYQSEKK